MKKLLTSAAICGLVFAAAPAQAGIDLELGGFFKGYGMFVDQDDDSTALSGEAREFDIIRSTEIHMGGETALDNGLTVGFHTEMEADSGGPNDTFNVQESYAYFSGGWGRINVGSEDGASYLLQVATPSADSNVDGIRQYVNGVNFVAAGAVGTAAAAFGVNDASGGMGYDQDVTGYADKLTYLSPIMNGFQVGVSYTPDIADASDEDGQNFDEIAGASGAAYEFAARYEGMFNNVGVILGAGYTNVDQEAPEAAIADGEDTDDRTAWNIGADLDIGPFGVGVSYSEDDHGEIATAAAGATILDDEKTTVVGVDYTTGPFKLGASYMDIENFGGIGGLVATEGMDADRFTVGVVYTYGPGMTFRGSISQLEIDNVNLAVAAQEDQIEATSFLLGTQINF